MAGMEADDLQQNGASRPDGRAPRGRGRRRRVRWRRLAFVLGVFVVAVAVVVNAKRLPETVAVGATAILPPPPTTVLVMGRQADQLSPLTDSMMLVAINPRRREMGVLSIPRDLWVEIPGYGHARINEAYMDGGWPLAEQVVASLTGIKPDYYVMINYGSFKNLVDTIGGVTVDVKHAIDDPTYPAPDECCGHYAPLHIPAGLQHMDGAEALAFMRERHDLPLADVSREANQQEFLLALKTQLLRPASLVHLRTLLTDVEAAVQTDFPLAQASRYVAALASVPGRNVRHAVLQYANSAVQGWTSPAGADVLVPEPRGIAAVVAQVFGGILPGVGSSPS